MNSSDSERLSAVLENAGYKKAPSIEHADLVAYNTCSVRQTAEDRVFGANNLVARLKNKNPRLKVLLTGCMVHYGERELKKRLPKFDIFLNIKDMARLPAILGINKASAAKEYLEIAPSVESRFSAVVPISYGCDNFCSYCIVPFARGGEYSRPAKEILAEIKRAVKNGYKEIWLLGQNVNSYGLKDKTFWANKKMGNPSTGLPRQNSGQVMASKPQIEKGRLSFAGLIREIDKIEGNFWLRFTSPHPKDFSQELIEALAESKHFKHYINLPIQSGDNTILRKMNRFYTANDYQKLVKNIRKAMPSISLSTDIIVGFPGETKKQFRNTAKLMQKIGFDMAYISKYSPRPKTVAAKKYKDDISLEEKKRRFDVLNKILRASGLKNNKKYYGKDMPVLVDSVNPHTLSSNNKLSKKSSKPHHLDATKSQNLREGVGVKDGQVFGKTETYKSVKLTVPKNSAKRLLGKTVNVKITKVRDFSLEGELTPGHKKTKGSLNQSKHRKP